MGKKFFSRGGAYCNYNVQDLPSHCDPETCLGPFMLEIASRKSQTDALLKLEDHTKREGSGRKLTYSTTFNAAK